jgi:HEAT repeat protein
VKPRRTLVKPLRRALRRSALRQRLQAAAGGTLASLSLSLDDAELDAASLLAEVARPLQAGTPALSRLASALAAGGALTAILDGLADEDPRRRERCARAVGALRLDAAIPWLRAQLSGDEAPVRLAAARALGRIGGARSADALLGALRARRVAASRLVLELTRAAPDHYIESWLADPRAAGIRASLATAAGLRRRRGSLPQLRRLALTGTERERAAACRALGWLGDPAASVDVGAALEHRSWRVRRAASRALGELGDRERVPDLYRRLHDAHPKMRAAAARALRRLGEVSVT